MLRSFLLICLLLSPFPLAAQGPRGPRFPTLAPAGPIVSAEVAADSVFPPADELGMGLGGLLSGFAGMVIGAYTGAMIDRAGGCSEWCGLEGALYGSVVGSGLMVPIGVHLANNQRGNLGRSVAYSLLTGGAGLAIAFAAEDPTPLLLIPFAQIVVAVAVEKATTEQARP